MTPWRQKRRKLEAIIDGLGSVVVAFSGGVDSSLLLRLCHDRLADKCLAATASSSTFPRREAVAAAGFARRLGATHVFFRSEELAIPKFRRNPMDRCYHCKRALFGKLAAIARRRGFAHVVSGETRDDLGDYRPGMKAGRELGVRRPLLEAGLAKRDVRRLARQLGLKVWDKPAAACLASRFPYGAELSAERFRRVEAAEEYILALGFRQVRVRDHGGLARLELTAADIARISSPACRAKICRRLMKLGFDYVSLDLAGFQSGSMNRTLRREGKSNHG